MAMAFAIALNDYDDGAEAINSYISGDMIIEHSGLLNKINLAPKSIFCIYKTGHFKMYMYKALRKKSKIGLSHIVGKL